MAQRIPAEEAIAFMISAGLEPLDPFTDTKTKWKCRCIYCKREVTPIYSKVKSGRKGCPYCAGNKVDLEELQGQIATLKLSPLHDYPGASTTWKMRCQVCNEEFNSRYDYIKIGRGCPFCSGARTHPKDAERQMKEVGLIPIEEFKSVASPWECRCATCGKVSKRSLHNVKHTGKGCPHCSHVAHRVPVEDMNNLARSLGYEPVEEYQGLTKLWRLKCIKCGTEANLFASSLRTRKRYSSTGLTGCLACSTKQKIQESNQGEIATLAMEKAGFEVLEPYVSSKHPWRVRCKQCSMEMKKQYSHVKSENKGCKYCAGNYLNEEQIRLIMVNAQLEPLEPYVNAQKPWKCKCLKCGKVVKPRFGGVSAGIGGCKFCGPHGLDFNKPAFVYLISHTELGAHKIGVSGLEVQTERLKAHGKYGWKLYKRLNVETGEKAYLIEQGVLTWLRQELGLGTYVLKEQMPQGGFSETVDGSEVDLPTIWSQVEKLNKVTNLDLV